MSIPVSISQASLVAIVVNISVDAGATAINPADYQLLTSSITFPIGDATNKNVVVRVFDDASVLEGTESLVLRLTLTSGTAVLTPNQTNTVSIPDNDLAPVSSTVLLSQDWEVSTTGWTVRDDGMASVNNWRVGAQILLAGTRSAYVSESTTLATYAGDAADKTLISPLIDATSYPTASIELSFKYRCNGQVGKDYGTLGYFTGAAPATFVVIEGTGGAPYQGVIATTTRTVMLPAVLKGTTFTIGWQWQNNNATEGNPAFVIDDIVVRTIPLGIETAVSGSIPNNQRYLGPNSTAYFYDNTTGKLMAKIENTSSHDYGCTSVVVDRVGVTGKDFVGTALGERLTSKTFIVKPTTNNPSGTYNARFY